MRSLIRRSLLIAAAVSLGAWLPGGDVVPDAAADPVHPVTLELESLSVGVGFEHRLLIVHPIQRPVPFKAASPYRQGPEVQPDTVGVERSAKRRKGRYRYANLMGEPVVLPVGTIVRDTEFDWGLTTAALVAERTKAEIDVWELSLGGTPGQREREVVDSLLPPTLRWDLAVERRHKHVRARVTDWMSRAEITEGRRSPADLATAPKLAERVEAHIRALASLGRAPDGLENVGYAAVLDGRMIALEVWSSKQEFASTWPRELRALAVEAVLEEIEQALPVDDLPAAANPDRHLAAVKGAMLELFGARPRIKELETMGELYLFPTLEEIHASAIVVDERVRHLVVLSDPDVQLEEPDAEEEFDPGVATRKLRPTQAERRLLERRRRRAERGDAPPIPPGPPGRGGDVELPPPPAPLPPGGR